MSADAERERREFMRLATRRTDQSRVAHLRSYTQYIGVHQLEPPSGWIAEMFVGDVDDAIAEARASRDAEVRAWIAEAKRNHSATCPRGRGHSTQGRCACGMAHMNRECACGATHHNAALDALLARLDAQGADR